ncbi:DUF1294 domain-containing protein [Oxalobacteraceae bacterium OM1]|nr:DUF1294 domain-containing protein [Oxalobacteraceae bacterium OM1]
MPIFLLLAWYAAASLAAFAAYGFDKSAARRAAHGNARRTPERTLHLLGVLGGWPGALLAQQVFRHKTQKTSFLALFWLTVALNCGLLLALRAFFTA